MLLLAEEVPIQLEVLDRRESVLSRVEARLASLYGEDARILLNGQSAVRCLHWGACVRFLLGDTTQQYQIVGTVIGSESREMPGEGDTTQTRRELSVRLWECRPVAQRRTLPRRYSRCKVEFQPWSEPEVSKQWQSGWSVDIGAGGMRFRTTSLSEAVPERLMLRFTLKSSKETFPFQFCGRILRAEKVRAANNTWEVAVRFERISVEAGLTLARFLTE